MITAFRICKTKYAVSAFDGEGAFRFGGRWNSRGVRQIYTAESLSLAVLEMLVHLQDTEIVFGYSFLEARFDEKLVKKVGELPENWRKSPPPAALQKIGDDWIKENSSAVLRVPSAIIPIESNYLINPQHSDFPKLILGNPQNFTFDQRLLKR
jgi:RES domain-containing protein